jgi:hypothetical protein
LSEQPKPAIEILKCPYCGCKALQADALTMCCSRAIKDALATQPKPATGEWTVKHDNMIYESRERVVSIHNAALAAVWKHSDTIAKLADDQVASFNATCDDLRDQLAAEKHQAAFDVMDVARKAQRKIEELEKQLAAAVEALKKVEYFDGYDGHHLWHEARTAVRAALATIGSQNWIRAEDNPGYNRYE